MTPTLDYPAFIAAKGQLGGFHGFEPVWMPEFREMRVTAK